MSALDNATNAIEDIEGKAKEVFGRVIGHEDAEAEDKADQAGAGLCGCAMAATSGRP